MCRFDSWIARRLGAAGSDGGSEVSTDMVIFVNILPVSSGCSFRRRRFETLEVQLTWMLSIDGGLVVSLGRVVIGDGNERGSWNGCSIITIYQNRNHGFFILESFRTLNEHVLKIFSGPFIFWKGSALQSVLECYVIIN